MGNVSYHFDYTPNSTITRPANATPYASGDAVSDTVADAHCTFTNVAKGNPRTGVIESAQIASSANQSALYPDLELWLFEADIAVTVDNAQWALTDAESRTLVGIVPFNVANWKQGGATVGAGGNAVCYVSGLNIPFRTNTANVTTLYGQLVVRNAYVPVSGEVFTIRLGIIQD
jgi:hypothetical protein